MKFISLAAATLAFVLPIFAADQVEVMCKSKYDDQYLPSYEVACSDYLYEHGWDLLGEIPTFPNLGAVPGAKCGTCYEVTDLKTANILFLLTVDHDQWTSMSEEACHALSSDGAPQIADLVFKEVTSNYCNVPESQ